MCVISARPHRANDNYRLSAEQGHAIAIRVRWVSFR